MHSFFCLKHSFIIILLNYLKLWGDSGCRSCWPLSYSKQILPSAVYVILHLMLSLVILPSTGGSMIVWQTIAIFIITRTNLLDWKEKYSLSHVQTCWTEKRNIHYHSTLTISTIQLPRKQPKQQMSAHSPFYHFSYKELIYNRTLQLIILFF